MAPGQAPKEYGIPLPLGKVLAVQVQQVFRLAKLLLRIMVAHLLTRVSSCCPLGYKIGCVLIHGNPVWEIKSVKLFQ